MKRREFISRSAALGILAALPACTVSKPSADSDSAGRPTASSDTSHAVVNPLTPPAHGPIPVAFVISNGTVMIDFAGPWQVFNDVTVSSRGRDMEDQMPFPLYTVAETMTPVGLSGGVKLQPEYTFANAPLPKIVVIPAQNGRSKAMLDWIRRISKTTDVTMSVCTGAFVLASTGLLSGKAATTHQSEYRDLAMKFPDIEVKRGVRFVEQGNLATSGGLSSGIDLALRVVERYFGRKVAADTAYNLEYQGQGWMDPNSNAVYLKAAISTEEHPLCPICSMEVDRSTSPKSI